ncbi:hypothetical protein O9992_13065 [Vibrio lentus]|nr:hypothetical protein [Vibrio lentus]
MAWVKCGGYGGGGQGDFGDIFGECLAIFLLAAVVVAVKRVANVVLIYVTTWSFLEEAVRGVSKEIEASTLVECDICDGSAS